MTTTTAPTLPKTFFLFAGMDEAEKSALIQGGKMRRFGIGENLFMVGDPVAAFHAVCDGAVQIFRTTPDGHEMTTEVLLAGDTVGETEILQHCPTHQFDAKAIKPTTIVEFPFTWLQDNLRAYPLMALNLLAQLSLRANNAAVEAEHRATMTAAQQVACFLERFCVLHNCDPHGFELPYSKTLIASRLGMELETFSRALNKIRAHGVNVQGTHVTFTSLDKMERFMCPDCSMAGNCPTHHDLKKRMEPDQRTRRA